MSRTATRYDSVQGSVQKNGFRRLGHLQAAGRRARLDRACRRRLYTQKVLRHHQGCGLIQGFVAGSAFGRVDAGGAAVFTLAGRDQVPGFGQEWFGHLVTPGRQTNTAGVAVIDEDGGLLQLRVQGVRNAADVVPVRQGEEGKHADQGMLDGMDAAHEMEFGLERGHRGRVRFQSRNRRFQSLRRKVKGYPYREAPEKRGAVFRSR